MPLVAVTPMQPNVFLYPHKRDSGDRIGYAKGFVKTGFQEGVAELIGINEFPLPGQSFNGGFELTLSQGLILFNNSLQRLGGHPFI